MLPIGMNIGKYMEKVIYFRNEYKLIDVKLSSR